MKSRRGTSGASLAIEHELSRDSDFLPGPHAAGHAGGLRFIMQKSAGQIKILAVESCGFGVEIYTETLADQNCKAGA